MDKHIEQAVRSALADITIGGGRKDEFEDCVTGIVAAVSRASQAPAPSPAAQAAIDAGYQTDANSAEHIEAVLGAAPSPAASIEGKDFYDLMQDYRHTPMDNQARVVATYDAVIAFANAHCARLASQSASAKDAAFKELIFNAYDVLRSITEYEPADQQLVPMNRESAMLRELGRVIDVSIAVTKGRAA